MLTSLPARQLPSVVTLSVLRDDQHRKCRVLHRIDRQRHPIERHGTFRRDEPRQFARGAQLEAGHIGQIVALDDGRDAIGVARDDMTAKFVADFSARARG